MLSTVEHVTERMNKLLLQLSTGSRGAENLRTLNLGTLAKRVADAKSAQRVSVRVETSGDVMAPGHEQRFERVLGHLVQNAIDASREGGAIAVRVFTRDRCAVIQVTDKGCGMSEDFVREKLFRPFQTTKQGGMGIGAYETAQYVRELGGRIEVNSGPDAGTEMRIIVPLSGENVSLPQQDREVA